MHRAYGDALDAPRQVVDAHLDRLGQAGLDAEGDERAAARKVSVAGHAEAILEAV